MSKVNSRVAFIGNIPFDLSETQLIEIFSEVGIVQGFRLVFDKETGKPRGFGFCSYADHETAASAVRNLNNFEINGRTLRVDFADSEEGDMPPLRAPRSDFQQGSRGATGGGGGGGGDHYQQQDRDRHSTSSYYSEKQVSSNSSVNASAQLIINIVKGMDPQQLAEVLAYLKVMISQSPDQAAALLAQNPQLGYGVFQALLSMNLVDAPTMDRILKSHSGYQSIGNNAPPPSIAAAPLVPQQQSAAQLHEQQQQLLMQLINLTPEQIAALPPDQQAQVIQVRNQYLQGQKH